MSTQKNRYEDPYSYKLIYVFRINDKDHEGCLKVGDTTVLYERDPSELTPSCQILNAAANDRINQYTNTAGVRYDLLYTELAYFKTDKGEGKSFTDKVVHRVLLDSGIKKRKITNAKEWFETDLATVKNAIRAVKKERKFLTGGEITNDNNPIEFRPSQEEAIEKTVKRFSSKSNRRFLWNAKMRFGKTLAAYEVVKRLEYSRTLIYTHRPVVLKGWKEDFHKIFNEKDTPWIFGNKRNQVNRSGIELRDLINAQKSEGKKFVYFASLQDLRGSKRVGGSFDKNDEVFQTDWDLVIVDEAHEGTQTEHGSEVLAQICRKDNQTKLLQLSGTPFNLITDYSTEDMYTWDYTMEQIAKAMWYKEHGGDHNPYAELPEMRIYTFDIAKQFSNFVDAEKAFNFREFFRVWSGEIERDGRPVPGDSAVGRFVHEKDVRNFLSLITRSDENSNYPFAKDKWRNYFRHTLWMVPGVAAAKALSALLSEHPVFSAFNIANVAGEGDEEEASKEALRKVEEAIGKNPEDSYSITLSCGRLTTGVSVKPWTAVMMLSGSYSTAAAQYLQTIFRVQTPAEINGMVKEKCYVFDFAPDRALKMMADAVSLSSKAGRSQERAKKAMGQLLNFCPIIAVEGTNMSEYNVEQMLVQLKKAYIDKVCANGFDNSHLYNFDLPELSERDLEMFDRLNKIAKASGQSKKPQDVIVNKQGMDEEEYDSNDDESTPKPKRDKTEEDLQKAERKKQRDKIISNLRAISIRIPLLVYGANIPYEREISIDNITDIVDDVSWEEFMPKGFTKQDFKYFKKYYDPEVFIGAGKQIRSRVKDAENLPVLDRVKEIAEIFSSFRNPDKETVLTPWRVVNMHMSDCLGGYDFWNESHTETIDLPRVVDNGKVTAETFWNPNVKFLEINSKTGLYPLYITYTVYRVLRQSNLRKTDAELWEKALKDSVFVICKTPMAEYITKRTLAGFKDIKVNAKYYPNLLKEAQESPKELAKKICDGIEFWKVGEKEMKFDAIVGNPPYQVSDGGNKASASPIYQYFVELAKDINPNYISMIMPARWYSGGKGLDNFRDSMLTDKRIEKLVDFFDSSECFPSADISGGICYFLWDKMYSGECEVVSIRGKSPNSMRRALLENGTNSFIRFNEAISILRKIQALKEASFSDKVSPRRPFGFTTDVKVSKIANDGMIKIYAYPKNGYVSAEKITRNKELVNKWKICIAYAYGERGDFPYRVIANPFVSEPNSCCSETYIILHIADSEEEAKNIISYVKTKFFRFLVLLKKNTQHCTQSYYQFVPIQDFSKPWTDAELYAKYGLTQEEIDFIESMIKPME